MRMPDGQEQNKNIVQAFWLAYGGRVAAPAESDNSADEKFDHSDCAAAR